MTPIKLAMLITAFFMWKPSMWRVWLAMMFNSLASALVPPLSDVQAQDRTLLYYMLIDGTTAAVVLLSPLGKAQRLIGLLFGSMMIAHAGFYFSPRGDVAGHYQLNIFMGWLQVACLFCWGAADVLERFLRDSRLGRRLFHRHAGTLK